MEVVIGSLHNYCLHLNSSPFHVEDSQKKGSASMNGRMRKRVYRALAILLALFVCMYLLQRVWVHRHTESENVECVPLLGWFTMEDRIATEDAALPSDLQPGDIILTLSTHSLGWRHGHAGLILDETSVLECTTWGQDSVVVDVGHWSTYSNYAVLRVKGVTEELQQEIAMYARENLCGIPYHLSAGFIGEKAPDIEENQFGLQCAYLVWYAWQHFGYDLDSDGGRLVTAQDLLNSKLLEVVQTHGMEDSN